MFETVKENTGCTSSENQEWFRNFLRAEENRQSYTADENSRQVNDGTTSEDKSSARDGAHGSGGDALHERFHLAVLSESSVIWSAEEHYHVRRCKDGESGQCGAWKSPNKIADESSSNYNWTGCDHGNRDRINELLFSQPVKLHDSSSIQKWHDRKSAAKNERTSFQKKEKEHTEGS